MHSKRPLCPGVLPGGVLREEGRVVLGALILVRRGGLAVGLALAGASTHGTLPRNWRSRMAYQLATRSAGWRSTVSGIIVRFVDARMTSTNETSNSPVTTAQRVRSSPRCRRQYSA